MTIAYPRPVVTSLDVSHSHGKRVLRAKQEKGVVASSTLRLFLHPQPSMKWLFVSFVAVLTLSLILTSVFGRTCYVCDTYKDPIGCRSESLNETYVKSCEEIHGNKSNAYFCRKINQYVEKLMGVSDERVVRQCGWEETKRDCYNRAGFGSRLTVCSCYEKDACNSALRLPTSWTLLTAIATTITLRQLL